MYDWRDSPTAMELHHAMTSRWLEVNGTSDTFLFVAISSSDVYYNLYSGGLLPPLTVGQTDYYPHWELNKPWHWPWEIHLKSSNGRTEIGTQAPPFLPQPSHYSIKIPLYGELWLVTKIIKIYTHLSRQASCFAYIILDRIRKWKIQWYFFFHMRKPR